MTAPAEALCPKCSSPRPPQAVECPACGVIYARYAPPRPRPVASAPPASAPVASASPAAKLPYVSAGQLEMLMVQLAELLDAGLTVRQALTGPLVDGLPPLLGARLRAGASADLPLSEIFEPLNLLDAPSLALVRAGEARGGLPQTLRQISLRQGERRAARAQLISGLAYPAFLLLLAAVVMPAPTLFTSGAGAYLGRVVPFVLLLGLAVGAFAYAPRLPPDAPLRRSFRSLGLSLPFVRVALYNGALATFADVLGTAVKAGLPVREALALSAEATPHPDFQKRAPEVIRQLDSGASLTAALAPLGLPHDFASQVATGETVGTLDQALPRLSQLYRERSQRATRRLLVGIGGIAFAIAAAVTALNIIQGYSSSLRGQEKLFERMERQ